MAHQTPIQKFVIKAYSKKELVILYNVSADTFRKWLNEIGIMNPTIKNAKILSPKIVEQIVEKLGEP